MSYHVPVLLKESLELLQPKKGGTYIDATLGGGGHTEKLLKCHPVQRVFGFDQDKDSIAYAFQRLAQFHDRLTLIKSNFEHLRTNLALLRVSEIDGALFDLGVSSHQIDSASRGFSFDREGDLDMRMDQSAGKSAMEAVNTLSVSELARIIWENGEEKRAGQIARWIDKARQIKPIKTTQNLTAIIEKNMRANPALIIKTKARVFQALRIYLNRELEVLRIALEDTINLLKGEGRLVVISYHSLEDRIIKTTFSEAAKGCVCPKSVLKCVCNQKPRVRILTAKAVTPSTEELQKNVRARSAKLRAIEKIQRGIR